MSKSKITFSLKDAMGELRRCCNVDVYAILRVTLVRILADVPSAYFRAWNVVILVIG